MLCNSRPADGELTVIPEDTGKPEVWQACQLCVSQQPKEAWINDEEL